MTAVATAPVGHADLEAAWERSDRIFALLKKEALLERPIRLRQPFLFYVGHLPAFAWNHVWRGVLGRPTRNARFDALFERGIDPPDDEDGAPDDAAAWPDPSDVLTYRDEVRESLREVDGDPALAPVLTMVVEHELMHHETLLYMVQQLARALKVRPSWLPSPGVGRDVTMERVSVPAGQAVLGAPRGDSFLWDNERPEQVVEVGAFRIDSLPVTNSELLRFVHAGGYEDRRLWTDDAWRWLGHRGRRLPELWRHGPEGLRVLTLFDERPFEEAARWPASVAQCEAAAYARWRGGRLPTEAELHRAAFATPKGETREHPWGGAPPTAEHGNLGFRSWEPTAVGSHPAGTSAFGVQELVGNGWEWTSTPFGPLRGFEPLARYPGYSADFFDGRHFVMLGASWATDVRLVRRSFRNWFQPHYPYVFSKFRCVWPA